MDKRVTYNLNNPIIKKGLQNYAVGVSEATKVGNQSRLKYALNYFHNNHITTKKGKPLTRFDLHALFTRACKINPTLAKLNDEFLEKRDKQRKMHRQEHSAKRHNKRLATITELKNKLNKADNKIHHLTNELGNVKDLRTQLKQSKQDMVHISATLSDVKHKYHDLKVKFDKNNVKKPYNADGTGNVKQPYNPNQNSTTYNPGQSQYNPQYNNGYTQNQQSPYSHPSDFPTSHFTGQ